MDYDEIKTLRNPGKWCHYMVNVGYMIAGLIIFAHVIWFFAASSILAHPPEIYLRDYIILPAIGLFALGGLADVLVRSKHTSVFAKEWIALSLFTVIAAYLCLSHDIARVLLASFMLSIFTSTIFSDVKLSRLMFAESIVSLLLIGGVLYFSGQMNDDLIMQIFVACFMCACAYLLSRIMVLHGRANLSALIKYNIEQHNMQEQMKLDTFTELYNRKTFDAYCVNP
jgi:hypothetical protein